MPESADATGPRRMIKRDLMPRPCAGVLGGWRHEKGRGGPRRVPFAGTRVPLICVRLGECVRDVCNVCLCATVHSRSRCAFVRG